MNSLSNWAWTLLFACKMACDGLWVVTQWITNVLHKIYQKWHLHTNGSTQAMNMYITYQIVIASNTSTIVRIMYSTVVFCVYVIVLYLFYIKWLFTNLFCSSFKQRIAISMHIPTHGRHMMASGTSKTTNFKGLCFYSMFLNWIATLFISMTFFYWQVFFRWLKQLTKQPSY